MYPATIGRRASCRSSSTSCANAPDEVGSGLAFITAPPEEFVPEPARGQPVIGCRLLLRGLGRGRRGGVPAAARVRPARDRPGRADAVRRRCSSCSTPRPRRARGTTGPPTSTTSCPTRRSTCSSSTRRSRCHRSRQIILVPGGGAIARVPEDATAFGQRTAPWNIHFLSMWADPADDDENIEYTRELAGGDEAVEHRPRVPQLHRRRGLDRVEAAFGPEKFARLQAVKTDVGPDQPVPPQPEHPAQVAGCVASGRAAAHGGGGRVDDSSRAASRRRSRRSGRARASRAATRAGPGPRSGPCGRRGARQGRPPARRARRTSPSSGHPPGGDAMRR